MVCCIHVFLFDIIYKRFLLSFERRMEKTVVLVFRGMVVADSKTKGDQYSIGNTVQTRQLVLGSVLNIAAFPKVGQTRYAYLT